MGAALGPIPDYRASAGSIGQSSVVNSSMTGHSTNWIRYRYVPGSSNPQRFDAITKTPPKEKCAGDTGPVDVARLALGMFNEVREPMMAFLTLVSPLSVVARTDQAPQ